MNNTEVIEALNLFNEKTDKLINSRYVKHLRENGIKMSLKLSVGKDPSGSHNFPTQDDIDAFTLTIRFFIQDNEASSLRNLVRLYENAPISNNLKNDFLWVRNKFNAELNKESFIQLNNQILTYAKIFDVFIYGNLAHANRGKKLEYDTWMKDKAIASFITGEFHTFLWYFLNCVAYIKKINNKALKELNSL